MQLLVGTLGSVEKTMDGMGWHGWDGMVSMWKVGFELFLLPLTMTKSLATSDGPALIIYSSCACSHSQGRPPLAEASRNEGTCYDSISKKENSQ